MKKVLRLPLLIVFVCQLLTLVALYFDFIFLSTGVKTLLLLTSFYSLGIYFHAKNHAPKANLLLLLLLSLGIMGLTFLKLFMNEQQIETQLIIALQFIQIHLFFIYLFPTKKAQIALSIPALLILLLAKLEPLQNLSYAFYLALGLLILYTFLVVYFFKNQPHEN